MYLSLFFILVLIAIMLTFLLITKSIKRRRLLRSLTEDFDRVTTDCQQNGKSYVKLSDNLSFSSSQAKSQTLVLLFGWLYSHDRHLQKYRNLYLDRHFDVLTVRSNVFDIIVPTLGSQVVAKYVAEFLKVHSEKYENIMVKIFSVGSYQFGEVLVQLKHNPNTDNDFRHKLRGIVFDSPIDYTEAPTGLATASTDNKLLKKLISNTMTSYMNLFETQVTRHYRNSSDSVKLLCSECPVLFLLSRDDPVIDVKRTLDLAEEWSNRGADVMCKCWHNSSHVSHYVSHPEEYKDILDQFIAKAIQ